MAIFTPRTFPEIFGEMIARLESSTPLTDVNFGSVWTQMLEAAAQEDDEQYFQMLDIIRGFSLDTTTGIDLDNRAFEYGLERLDAQSATSFVTLRDSAITKVSTDIYSGLPGPVSGGTIVRGNVATGFATSGSVVVGRGTPNVETVPYASITQFANYVEFNLSAGLTFDHGTDETIILSQGGNRLVVGGTVVFVPPSDLNPRLDYSTDADATILDGESEVTGVAITASLAGTDSNVPIGSIQKFDALPFSTAIVTNPQRITNGSDIESDQDLRDRIKDTIQSLSRGTGRAILTSILGVVSEVENKRVVSAAIIEPTTPADVVKVFIDDGSGFIPTLANIGFEEVVPVATGGEKFLTIGNVPIVKAFVETADQEVYALSGGESLFVALAGQVETITFASTDFEIPGSATAQEVAAKFNANAETFEARISDNGTRVRIFSRSNVGEEIRVTGGTANAALNFPTDLKFTTKAYLEENFETKLLSKDGRTASVESGNTEAYDFTPFGAFETKRLQIIVDGKTDHPIAFDIVESDFVDPSSVTAEQIVDLFETQVPGIRAVLTSGDTKFTLFSKTERSATSKIRVIDSFDHVENEESATLVDRTSDINNDATNTAIMVDDLDYVYFGNIDVDTGYIHFELDTPASEDLGLVWEIYAGAPTNNWVALPVNDNTNGLQNDGWVTWGRVRGVAGDVSVNGSTAMHFVRAQRNNSNSLTNPIVKRARMSPLNKQFGFAELERVGQDKDYTLNRFIGQLELETPMNAGARLTIGSTATRARVTTAVSSIYALSGGELFEIEIDGTLQSYSFVAGDFFTPGSALPSEIKVVVDREFVGVTTTLVDGGNRVQIESNTWNNGTIKVNATAANTALQFPTDLKTALESHVGAMESVAEPYVLPIGANLLIVMDENLINNFNVPVTFLSSLTGAAGVSSVTDTTLNVTFPLDTDLVGFDIEMTSGAQTGERKEIATYTAATGVLTTTTPFSGTPLAADTYEIIPKDADQVVQFMNNQLITTLTSEAVIQLSGSGTKVQIASKVPGEDGSVTIIGGTANAVLLFPSNSIAQGIDAYRYYTGLAQVVQKTIDGTPDEDDEFDGVRAAGVQVEVIEPIRKPIEVEVDVTPQTGVTLASITNNIKSAISTVINNLPVGGDVIASDIVCAVKDVAGVFDIELIRLDPRPLGEQNVPIADSEQARTTEDDIQVG